LLDYDIKTDGNTLYFYEKSNGRLPLFSLVYHESLTELQIRLPEGYDPEMIKVGSTGGHVFITGIASNIQVDTMNGRIELVPVNAKSANIIAKTNQGNIYSNGKPAGQKTDKGTEYISAAASDRNIELTSTNGNIYIQ
jgi:hypothetical protein